MRNRSALGRARDRGTAATEMAILLPLYILLAFGFLFFGFRAILQARMQPAIRYVLGTPDVQQASSVEPFLRDLGEEDFQGEGRITNFQETLDESPLPAGSAIEEALVEETYDPVGRYVFNPVTMMVEFQMDPDRLAPRGRYILRNRLLDVAASAATAAEGWLARSRTTLGYQSDIFHMATELDLASPDLRPGAGAAIIRGQKTRGPHQASLGEQAVQDMFGTTLPPPRNDTSPFFPKN